MFKNILKYISSALVLILILTSCQKANMTASTQSEAEDIKKIAEEILKKDYQFFKGNAIISEEQKWTSKYQDGSHGEGNAVFSSADYLVYEPDSQKFYILARSMTYDSNHKVTVNDMNGNYIQTADIHAVGALDEFYGNGFVINQDGSYVINFASNPVRIDAAEMSIFTMPEVNNKQWVSYHSTADTVRLGDARVLPPDSAQNEKLAEMPQLDSISDSKTYGNKESRVYEATSRLWNVKGSFDYSYEKIDADKALTELNEIYKDSNKNTFAELIGDSTSNLDANWKDVINNSAEFADTLDASVSANNRLDTIFSGMKAAHATGNYTDEQIADTIVNSPEINEILKSTQTDPAQSLNSLEKAVLKTSDSEFIEIFNLSKALLLENLESYSKSFQAIQDKLAILNLHLSKQKALTPDQLNAELNSLFMNTKDPTVTMKSSLFLEICFHNMYTFANINEPSSEDAQRYLKNMFQSIHDEVAMSNAAQIAPDASVSMPLPENYPKDLVPIIEDSIIFGVEEYEGVMNVSLKTNLEIPEASEFYISKLKGISAYNKMNLDNMVILSGEKSNYTITVMVMPNTLGGDQPTLVQISLLKN